MKRLAILGALLTLTLLAMSAFAYPQAKASGPSGHCVMTLAPMQAGQTASAVRGYSCYATFAQAIAAATGGRVHLSETTRPQDVTQQMLNASVSPNVTNVFAVEYVDANWQGSSLTYTTTAGGCSSTTTYGVTSMPSGWNDVISSELDYDGCNNGVHWENNNYTGASVNCYSCSNIGAAMNDRTSSIYWRP